MANKVASQLAAMAALNATAQSPWLSGLKFDTYTDCYDAATGELKTFYTSGSYVNSGAARALNPDESKRKIGGRIVLNSAGQEVKLYNGFVSLISGTPNVAAVDILDAEKNVLGKFTAITGAKFGIFAVETDEDSNSARPAEQGGFYKVIRHSLQAKADQPKPTKAELAAA